jgi:hypothetical protein
MNIEDRYAIEQHINRYAFLLDSGQHHRVAEDIFTEDAVIDYGVGPLAGHAAINAFFTSFTGAIAATAHCYSNFIIEIDGHRAKSLTHVTAWHWLARENRDLLAPADITSVGGSQDELRRTADGWRINARIALQYGVGIGVVPDSIRPILEGMSGRRPNWPA